MISKTGKITRQRLTFNKTHVSVFETCGEGMRFVGKSKIGRLSAKKGKIYAQIRLPPQLADTIGDIATIFETEHNGKRAFLLVTKSVPNDNTVLQLNEKVVKSEDHNHYDYRLSALESEINELKSLLFSNERSHPHKNETNGLGRFEPATSAV